MATHSSILAWRIPQTEEPGGLPSTGSQRLGTVKPLQPPQQCTLRGLRVGKTGYWPS